MRIIGMREEFTIEEKKNIPTVVHRFIVLGIFEQVNIQLLIIFKKIGDKFVFDKVRRVSNFGGFTYVPKHELHVEEKRNGLISDENILWSIPKQTLDINLFKKTIRAKDKRPVWIFKGDSNSGKSFLSHLVIGKSVYETDSSSILKEIITEDIIVLGNKYKFSIEEIENKIFGEHESIIVDFTIQNKGRNLL